MKGFARLITILMVILLTASMALAAGITLIPGSRDGEGSLGEDGKSWGTIRGTTNIIMEGATSDAYEATLTIPDPGSDITYTFPATSGTLAVSGASPVGATLTDAKVLIGNSAGTAVEQTVSLTGEVTGTLVNSGAIATTLANNSVTAGPLYYNSVSVFVADSGSSGTATVTAGSIILGAYPVANVNNIGDEMINSISISDTTLTLKINGTASTPVPTYAVVVIEP